MFSIKSNESIDFSHLDSTRTEVMLEHLLWENIRYARTVVMGEHTL